MRLLRECSRKIRSFFCGRLYEEEYYRELARLDCSVEPQLRNCMFLFASLPEKSEFSSVCQLPHPTFKNLELAVSSSFCAIHGDIRILNNIFNPLIAGDIDNHTCAGSDGY